MNKFIEWVYNHVDISFVVSMIIMLGIILFIYALIFHSKNNNKIPHLCVAFAMIVAAGALSCNLKWSNSFESHKRRAGISRVVYIKGSLYRIEDTSSERITLIKIDLYNDSFAKRYEATYGCAGSADNLLDEVLGIDEDDKKNDTVGITPSPKEVSLDCSTPK